ncbi:uncharacterized protein LOC100182582 [Ciona intestinalis]
MVDKSYDDNTSVKGLAVVTNDQNPTLQPMGLIPLYFPPIKNNKTALLPSNPNGFSNLGFSFLPPIYQQAEHYGRRHNFTDGQINAELNLIVQEVVTEQVLDLFEEVLVEGVEPSSEAKKKIKAEKEAQLERVAKALTIELIEEVIREDKRASVLEFFDEKIANHRLSYKTQNFAESLFRELETELVEEVMYDVLDSFVCGEACISVIHEVVYDETQTLVQDTLMHYGARAAFSQYKQISKYAGDYILDSMCVQSLLPQQSKPSDALTPILDHLMVEVLLHNMLQHDNVKEERCLPLQWYQKKLILGVMFDDTLSKLCTSLDNLTTES